MKESNEEKISTYNTRRARSVVLVGLSNVTARLNIGGGCGMPMQLVLVVLIATLIFRDGTYFYIRRSVGCRHKHSEGPHLACPRPWQRAPRSLVEQREQRDDEFLR